MRYNRALIAAILTVLLAYSFTAQATSLPAPMQDNVLAGQPAEASVVLAGGCFWGIQGVFQHVKGVKQAVSGYAGGDASTAQYKTVSTGTTGHAESVKVIYDPSQITLGQILQIFFAVAHDPTELNYQGPDHGTQYRSAIFYASPEQQKIAEAYVAQLNNAKAFEQPVVTKLEALTGFYPAEDYHQDYMRLHPANPYILINDAPKVKALHKEFPALYSEPN